MLVETFTPMEHLQKLSADDVQNIYSNALYIAERLPNGSPVEYPDPASNGFTGYDTLPSLMLDIMRGIEENINTLEGYAGGLFINEYYGYDRLFLWNKESALKESLVNRWIDYLNLAYRVISGQMPQPQYLTDKNGEYITDINNEKILCYGEVYKK